MIRAVTFLLCLAGLAPAEEKPIWLAVGRPGLVEGLAPLVERRQQDGFQAVVSTGPVDRAIAAQQRRPAFLVLVGDDEPGQESAPWHLAAKRRELYRWTAIQRPSFASDAAWGDLDGDLAPDIPVGRIPARTRAEVELVVNKTLAFERRQPTAAGLQIPIWGGSPDYGPLVDSATTGLLVSSAQMFSPRWSSPWLISSDAQSPYCGWPPEQPELFTSRLKGGDVVAVIMAHGSRGDVHGMNHGGKSIDYSASLARKALGDGLPAAPLVIFSCNCGDFAGRTPCMAEEFLLLPAGPVAVVAATTESHPLTNYYSGVCFMQQLGAGEKRLGSLWLNAQRKMMKTQNPMAAQLLGDVEGKLEPVINVEKLKRDQMLMYAVLGDPALALKLPERLGVRVERTAAGWRWETAKPTGATALEVGLRPEAPPPAATPGVLEPGPAREAQRAANALFAFAAQETLSADKPWQGTVERPGWLRLVAVAPGRLYVAAVKLSAADVVGTSTGEASGTGK